MKQLKKIRLINWHYFIDETITIDGSALLSGENASGKSTILDAIQFALTASSKKNFNVAANEKSSRDLRGYVRCKTGDETKKYLRQDIVISYIALEFFDTKNKLATVMGVRCESKDESAPVSKKWFFENGYLSELLFINGENKPSQEKEFLHDGKKIVLYEQIQDIKVRIQRRLGSVDEKFFELIPKSLAFKPMEKVKQFINDYLLPKKAVNIEKLKQNIETLKELENLVAETERRIECLKKITQLFDNIENENFKKKSIEILLKYSDLQQSKIAIENYKSKIKSKSKEFERQQKQFLKSESEYKSAEELYIQYRTAQSQNSFYQIIEECKKEEARLNAEKARLEKGIEEAKKQQQKIKIAASFFDSNNRPDSRQIAELFEKQTKAQERQDTFDRISDKLEYETTKYIGKKAELSANYEQLKNCRSSLLIRKELLDKKKFEYSDNLKFLKSAIEDEFVKRNIKSDVYILCELLSLSDETWRDAVEGYLNTQRFYLLVEPEHFKIASEVYKKIKSKVHSEGVINTEKIDSKYYAEPENDSLAYVVSSKHAGANAYVNFLLSGVKRCSEVSELQRYRTAITKDCMLYKNHVLRRLDPKLYQNPYIGENAIRIQLKTVTRELEENKAQLIGAEKEIDFCKKAIESFSDIKLSFVEEYLFAYDELKGVSDDFKENSDRYSKATKGYDFAAAEESIKRQEQVKNLLYDKMGAYRDEVSLVAAVIKTETEGLEKEENQLRQKQIAIEGLKETFEKEYEDAALKYRQNIVDKSPEIIIKNYSGRLSAIETNLSGFNGELQKEQLSYNHSFKTDFTLGTSQSDKYREEQFKLVGSQIIEQKEKTVLARRRCEEEFRYSFLASIKENIFNARKLFQELNESLKDIEYGDENYKFLIDADKNKIMLYKMITDANNLSGINLLSDSFNNEYAQEIEELFSKLMVDDDSANKIIEEYTDYRNYLDYDIEINKSGSVQKFSKICLEKSGGETQTPYYVAIAASYKQIYGEDTVRLIMLDEAFDKLDNDRIESMMKFFNSLGFQTILATPPSKIEVIGEHVNTVLTVHRIGRESFVNYFGM